MLTLFSAKSNIKNIFMHALKYIEIKSLLKYIPLAICKLSE